MRNFSKLAFAIGLAITTYAAVPASAEVVSSDLIQQARTICREDGRCFNTSGRPVYQRRVRRERWDGDNGMRRYQERDYDRRGRYGYDG